MKVPMPSTAAFAILVLVLLGVPRAHQAQGMQLPNWRENNADTFGDQTDGIGPSNGPGKGASVGEQQTSPKTTGGIRGTVVDQTGANIVGARVRLTREDQSSTQEVVTGDDGQFSFSNVAPGTFQLTIAAAGLVNRVISGALRPEEDVIVPEVVLALATQETQITVRLSQVQIAEGQIKEQEKQRVLGFIPNFYVSYVPNAVALTSKQKFEIAWKSSIDPLTLVGVGFIAGIQQASNRYSEYGQGAQGYAKRYAAFYGDVVMGTFLGSAVLPSVLKQDPRYFYKGNGSKRSRILYALSSPFLCNGDNGHRQANYSYLLGTFAASGISNFYYPASNRNGAELVFETALMRLGESAIISVAQEFIFRKLTPHLHSRAPSQP
jgi:hypothetical protein